MSIPIRFVGITVWGGKAARDLLERCSVDWPVLLDPRHSGGASHLAGRVFYSSPTLKWGGEDVFDLKNFETFVIDPAGKILAVGLEGDESQSVCG